MIAVNFTEKLILIGGTAYAGEMKKIVFGILNYLLPVDGRDADALLGQYRRRTATPRCSSACRAPARRRLSADASRTLIGDDEHGWSDTAVFNFEGGCYAKMIRLSAEAEPEIFATTKRFGTVLENVVMDPETRELDFDDNSLAENSRGSYPIDFIPNTSEENLGPVPKNIILLTADAYGVLPPIAQLTPDQAMYHFLSGYTARVAGTEIGVTEPDATFSTCFGAPFMPRHPSVYGNLLKERIAKGGVDCWLVNTGWTGGKYGAGKRMPIKATRALLNAALDGSLNDAEFRTDPNFGFEVPVAVPGVDADDPRSARRPGPTRPTMTRPRRSWSTSSSTTSRSSRSMSTKACDQRCAPTQDASPKPPDTPGALRRASPESPTMTDHRSACSPTTPRSAASARACSPARLPRAEWTHEAHLAACLWLIGERPDIDARARHAARSSAATTRASAA